MPTRELNIPQLENLLYDLLGSKGGPAGGTAVANPMAMEDHLYSMDRPMQVELDKDAGKHSQIQQLAQYLKDLGNNIENIEPGDGGEGIESIGIDPNTGDVIVSFEGDTPDSTFEFLTQEKLFPWTYGVPYDNRNESSASTSGGGAWLAKTAEEQVVHAPNSDFDLNQ